MAEKINLTGRELRSTTDHTLRIMIELDQNLFSITNSSELNHFVDPLMCNQHNYGQSGGQMLSSTSGDIVPIFTNPQDEKEWREGFEKHCTKPSANGRYPEDCFFGPPF